MFSYPRKYCLSVIPTLSQVEKAREVGVSTNVKKKKKLLNENVTDFWAKFICKKSKIVHFYSIGNH